MGVFVPLLNGYIGLDAKVRVEHFTNQGVGSVGSDYVSAMDNVDVFMVPILDFKAI